LLNVPFLIFDHLVQRWRTPTPLFWTLKPQTINKIAFLRYMMAMEVRRYCLIPLEQNIPHINPPGSTVAKYAGLNVHKRLVTEETYKNDDYEVALKKAFLGTDEDILASQFTFGHLFVITLPNWMYLSVDPAHTREPSGCTAVAALLTSDNKIYVVRPLSTLLSVSS
jgi:hypothetical protein